MRIGGRGRVRDLATGEEEVYTIVGSAEADPTQHRISHRSPVAQALLGRRVGETVSVEVPAGTLQYRIEAIEEGEAG